MDTTPYAKLSGLARNAVPPINSAEAAINNARGQSAPAKAGAVVQKQIEDLFGLKNPGPGQTNFLNKQPYYDQRNRRETANHPSGAMENAIWGR